MYPQLLLENQFCFRLYTAARMITASYTPYFKPFGITYAQYLVLMVLWERDHRIISEITECLHLETNTVTPLLKRMESQGLIIRQQSQADNRQRIVSLSSEGHRLQEKMKDIPNCLAREIIGSGISIQELTSLVPILDKFIAAISQQTTDSNK
ncbi:MAG: MarR family transcriptional regulator [Bacteroidales bacterium]|nr:MarR family transcriptional regulator [Bacteroidales bacterium]